MSKTTTKEPYRKFNVRYRPEPKVDDDRTDYSLDPFGLDDALDFADSHGNASLGYVLTPSDLRKISRKVPLPSEEDIKNGDYNLLFLYHYHPVPDQKYYSSSVLNRNQARVMRAPIKSWEEKDPKKNGRAHNGSRLAKPGNGKSGKSRSASILIEPRNFWVWDNLSNKSRFINIALSMAPAIMDWSIKSEQNPKIYVDLSADAPKHHFAGRDPKDIVALYNHMYPQRGKHLAFRGDRGQGLFRVDATFMEDYIEGYDEEPKPQPISGGARRFLSAQDILNALSPEDGAGEPENGR